MTSLVPGNCIHPLKHWSNSSLGIVDSGKEVSHSGSHGDRQTDTVADETTPLLTPPPYKRPHPFIFLLQALFPFGEDFRQLGLVGKIYELIKVLSIIRQSVVLAVLLSPPPLLVSLWCHPDLDCTCH